MNKIYHFTSHLALKKIKQDGKLSKGFVPLSLNDKGKLSGIKNMQWLTTSDNWEQPWANAPFAPLLPYRRSEWKIEIHIPSAAQQFLHNWFVFCSKHRPASASYLNHNADPENWRIFAGHIPVAWFESIDRNPFCENLKFDELQTNN